MIIPSNNNRLYKWISLLTTSVNKYCRSTHETITHLFLECTNIKPFWSIVIDLWKSLKENVTVTATDILYGYNPESTSALSVSNHYLLIAIFQAILTNHLPWINSCFCLTIKFAVKRKLPLKIINLENLKGWSLCRQSLIIALSKIL